MVQIRIMTDDQQRGEDVAEVLLPLLQACTALTVSEPTRLNHRGGGLRLVLDVQLAPDATTVRIERADSGASAGPPAKRAPRRRALSPRDR